MLGNQKVREFLRHGDHRVRLSRVLALMGLLRDVPTGGEFHGLIPGRNS